MLDVETTCGNLYVKSDPFPPGFGAFVEKRLLSEEYVLIEVACPALKRYI